MISEKLLITRANILKAHGELKGIITKSHCVEVFYTFQGSGYKIVYTDDVITHISKLPESEIDRMMACANLDFGNW
jgi:hypothetical protein